MQYLAAYLAHSKYSVKVNYYDELAFQQIFIGDLIGKPFYIEKQKQKPKQNENI